jgi:hypothetical protein
VPNSNQVAFVPLLSKEVAVSHDNMTFEGIGKEPSDAIKLGLEDFIFIVLW